jgi:hypothetical protein
MKIRNLSGGYYNEYKKKKIMAQGKKVFLNPAKNRKMEQCKWKNIGMATGFYKT